MTNIPSINFNKVIDKGNTLFNQTEFYEGNFDKINQQLVVKVNELDTQAGLLDADLGNAEGRLDLAETDLDTLELNKVDKVPGKVLSTNDYTTEEKAKVTHTPLNTVADLGNKVDKVTGKGLSANDYTTEEKNKVTNLPLDTLAQLGEIETKQGLLTGLLTTAKTSIVNAINELFNNKANKVQENWITPTLSNGWLIDKPVGYIKDNLGFVNFQGRIKSGSIGLVICQLPLGYRPSDTRYFICFSNSSVGALIIDSVGQVVALSGSNLNFSLDNIRFRAV